MPRRGFADDCARYRKRGVGYSPVTPAPAEGPADVEIMRVDYDAEAAADAVLAAGLPASLADMVRRGN
jgi:hypothetical protein